MMVSMRASEGLETAAHRLTDLFPPARGFAAARHTLAPAALRTLRRDGFVAGIPVLDARQLAALRTRLDALVARLPELEPRLYEVEQGHRERPGEVVCHFLGAWRVDEAFHDLVFAPAVTVPLLGALGVERLRFWHDQVFVKPARHPGVVPWHQDYSYWTRTVPENHVTMNVLLDDATEANGCVWFVPGSHRWGLLPKAAFDGPMDELVERLPAELRDQFHPVAAPVRAGEATIHLAHTLHGSYANQTDAPRRAVVLNYMGAETRSASDEPLLRGVPPIPAGAVVEGPFFPVVLDAETL
jgi:ectoine hydroxylase-related dioxygenase (phytanoyl-CoA dioxygenase family)